MTQRTFLIADPHFGHQGVCEFLRKDGTKLRPWTNAAEMTGALVANWNEVVKPTDKVYVLGDVVFSTKHLWAVNACHGDKVLIKGNHDTLKLSQYAGLFRDVRACHQLGGCILTHIPVHPSALSRWKANIHGHTHANEVTFDRGDKDPRYVCVSVEQINYRPILLDEALARVPT